MDTFFTIWWVVGLLAMVASIFAVGYFKNEVDDACIVIINVAMVAIAWPFLLALAIAISPFYGIYQLGKLLGKKQQ